MVSPFDFLDKGQPPVQGPGQPQSNPFSSILSMLSGGGQQPPMAGGQPAPAPLSAASQGVPTSPMAPTPAPSPSLQKPNRFTPGSLMWMLSGGSSAPTQQEYMLQRSGQAQSGIAGKLQELVTSGVSPQKAILEVMKTPEGQDYFATGGDIAGLAKMATLSGPDPSEEANKIKASRAEAFGTEMDPAVLTKQAGVLAARGDEEGAKLALAMADSIRQIKSSDIKPTPESIQRYEYYTRQKAAAGEEPLGIFEWERSLKKAGVPGSETDPDALLRTELDKKTADEWKAYRETGAIAAASLADMEMLDELIKLAPSSPLTGPLLKEFPGLSNTGAAFTSIINRIAPTQRAPGSGSTSDIEYDGMLKSLPSLSNKPEANQVILEAIKVKATINLERSEIIDAFQNKEISSTEARKQMAVLNRKSIMTPELKAAIASADGGGKKGEKAVDKIEDKAGVPSVNGKSVSEMSDAELEAIVNGE